MKITDAQRRALQVLAAHPAVAWSNTTDPDRPCISATVGQRLVDARLAEHVSPRHPLVLGAWSGTTDATAITNAGRVALA